MADELSCGVTWTEGGWVEGVWWGWGRVLQHLSSCTATVGVGAARGLRGGQLRVCVVGIYWNGSRLERV